MEPTKFDPISHTLTDDLKAQLKTLVPEAFTENAIDFDRLKTILGEMVDGGQERYAFTWPGKTQAIRAAQTPSIGTLVPVKEASEDWDTTGNLYLEGDNLEILKLLQKSYTDMVKMIYIDPPYNTGKDFVYPDNYGEGLKTYLEYTGQVDGEGKKITTNTETDGRYHSKWLNMMYPRLMLARNLLKDDGVIFISIDDHEAANLQKICNEIFGEDMVERYIWDLADFEESSFTKTASNTVRKEHEYIIACYKKEMKLGRYSEFRFADREDFINPDNDPRGAWMSGNISRNGIKSTTGSKFYTITTPLGKQYSRNWTITEEEFHNMVEDNRIYFSKDGEGVPRMKIFKSEASNSIQSSVLKGLKTSITGKNQIKELFNGKIIFDFPKPTNLIKRLIELSTSSDSLIVDFFSGSAPTAHSVMELNAEDRGSRKFILTQLQEQTPEDSEARKAGYQNIAELGRERVKRAGAKIKTDYADKLVERETSLDTGFRTYRLTTSTFNTWDTTSDDDIQAKLLNVTSLIKTDANTEDVLTELILKSGYGLSEIVTATEVNGVKVYSVAEGELMIVLEGAVREAAVRAIADMSPKRFIAREDAFSNDASLTNTAQIMKDKGIDFRVL